MFYVKHFALEEGSQKDGLVDLHSHGVDYLDLINGADELLR